ncbi:MAG: nucleotidyltransferase family protein [Blastocatellia bacterium]
MTLEQVKEFFQTEAMKELCRQNGVERLCVFGSTARNEATEQSDLDLLVKFSESKKLGVFEFMAIEDKLAEAVHHKVDLVMESSLSGRRGENIRRDLQVIYAS